MKYLNVLLLADYLADYSKSSKQYYDKIQTQTHKIFWCIQAEKGN